MVRCMNSAPSINLGSKYGVKGGSFTLSSACASGAHALGMAYLMIKIGWNARMIARACQELCWESMAAVEIRPPIDAAGLYAVGRAVLLLQGTEAT